ncbi:MAG: DUF1415 domain-containing protein [Methylococcales symbiont of Hymedesmia sp. n. MRB-2018]|nr:MAG: DUF1415 domain-containing protein [Methylococcales symbiont of Hymedesmia sp. n. MRB-2018]
MSTTKVISQTKHWISSFVIDFNICPFAYKSFINNSIYFSVNNCTSVDNCLLNLFSECERLDNSSQIETTFLIFPNLFQQFDSFLDFLFVSEELLMTHNYDGTYQLASFHPHYRFDNEVHNDPASFTNRSPYPMLHLIREASITKALINYPHPELIPNNNIRLTRKLGLTKLQAILNNSLSI